MRISRGACLAMVVHVSRKLVHDIPGPFLHGSYRSTVGFQQLRTLPFRHAAPLSLERQVKAGTLWVEPICDWHPTHLAVALWRGHLADVRTVDLLASLAAAR